MTPPGDVGRPMGVREALQLLARREHFEIERLRTGLLVDADLEPGEITRAIEAARASWEAGRCELIERLLDVLAEMTKEQGS